MHEDSACLSLNICADRIPNGKPQRPTHQTVQFQGRPARYDMLHLCLNWQLDHHDLATLRSDLFPRSIPVRSLEMWGHDFLLWYTWYTGAAAVIDRRMSSPGNS